MDSTGHLWPLLREGDSLAIGGSSQRVARLSALVPATGAEGTTRGLSASGEHIAVQVRLSDGSQAIVKFEMP